MGIGIWVLGDQGRMSFMLKNLDRIVPDALGKIRDRAAAWHRF